MTVRLVRVNPENPLHVSFMWNVRTDPRVDEHLTGDPPDKFYKHAKYLYDKSGVKAFFIIMNNKDEACGYCQIDLIGKEHEVGFALKPDFWGQGIGTEATKELVKWVKDWNDKISNRIGSNGKPVNDPRKSIPKLVLYVKEDNARAIKVYEKCGFSFLCKYQPDNIKMELEL